MMAGESCNRERGVWAVVVGKFESSARPECVLTLFNLSEKGKLGERSNGLLDGL